MGASELSEVTKGAQILTDAAKAGKTAAEGVQAAQDAGINPATLTKGLQALKDASLDNTSLLSKGLARNLGTQVASKLGMSAKAADTVGQGFQFLTAAGFTAQQAQQAAELSPRVLDALHDGDYATAERLGIDALGSAALGSLGAHELAKESGGLMSDAAAKIGLKVKPSEENLAISRNFGEYDKNVATAGRTAELWASDLRHAYPKMSPDQLERIRYYVESGMDADTMAQRRSALSEAAGRPTSPENGLRGVADDWGDLERTVSSLTGKHASSASIADIEKAGGSRELQNQWSDYMNRPFAPTANDSVLAEHSRSTPVPAAGNLSPALLLNDYAHELISRTPEMDKQRDWKGVYFQADEVHKIAKSLIIADPRTAPLADALEKTLGDKAGLLLSKQTEDHNITFDHEQIHHWQDQNPLPPSKNNEIRSNPHFQEALDDLKRKGYNYPDHYIDEIGAHLGSGDTLGLGKKEAASLAKSYFGAHSKESLQNLPASSPLVVQSLKELGHDENINRGAAQRLLEQKARASRNPAQITSGLSPERLQEVISQKNLAAKYTPAEINRLLDAYDPSKLTDADKEVAAKIRSQFNDTLEYAQKNDALGEGVSHYVTNLWKKEEGPNPAANLATHAANTGEFTTNTSQARSRMFDNSFEGQIFGKHLEETDPITLAAHNASTFARVIEARKAVERLADSGTRASDGRPLVALSGTGKVLDEGDPAVLVNPNGRRSVKVADNVIQGLKDSGDLDRLVKEGKIQNLTRRITPENIQPAIDRLERSMIGAQPKFDEEGNSILLKSINTLKAVRDGKLPKSALDDINAQRPDVYAWNPSDYSHIDHPSLVGWNHVAQSPSGDAVLMKSDFLVHPEAKEYVERRLGVDSQGPADNPVGKALMKINAESKGLTLSLSPFHILQIGLRGVMSGVSPFKIERWDLANDPVLAKGVENGLTLKTNYKNRSAFSDGNMQGHSMVLDKIPGLRTIQNSMNSFLFDKYIPAVKSSVYKALVDRYQKAYPEWTPEKAAEVAADDTNSRLGGINYRKLGRAAATQNFFKMSTLASDWLESEIRSIARPFGTEGKIARQDLARITAYMWMSARVLNMLTTGTPHMEAPFGVAYKTDSGKDATISMRSLPSDLLHAVSDPYGFIRGRVSPLVRAGSELYSGTDSFGRKLTKPDLFADIMRNNLPIPTQSIGKSLSGMTPETGNTGQIIGALGGTDTIYRSEAQKLAAQMASDRSESGPVDPDKLARHNHLMDLENQLRTNQITHQQVQDLYIDGHITQAEKSKIDKNFTQTRGLPADQAQLLIRASRLDAPSLLKLWDVATPTEKAVLAKTMSTAKTRYITKAVKELTPQQRQDDPTIKRLRTMFVTPQIQ
jgi:hypothetical protein